MRPETEPPGIVATRGSFSYARLSGDRIRLHFRSAESDGRSSLGSDRRGERVGELAAPFEHLKSTAGGPGRGVGAAWLYNPHPHPRLFPRAAPAAGRGAPRPIP